MREEIGERRMGNIVSCQQLTAGLIIVVSPLGEVGYDKRYFSYEIKLLGFLVQKSIRY